MLRMRMTGDRESRGQEADPVLPGKWPLKHCVWGGDWPNKPGETMEKSAV